MDYAHRCPITGRVDPENVTFYPRVTYVVTNKKGDIFVVTDDSNVNNGSVEVVDKKGNISMMPTADIEMTVSTDNAEADKWYGRKLLRLWGVEEPKIWTEPWPKGYSMGSFYDYDTESAKTQTQTSPKPVNNNKHTNKQHNMKKISESAKVTLTLGQIKRLVKEASKFKPSATKNGTELAMVEIEKLKQTAENVEKVQHLRELVGKFTTEAVERARQAKAEKSAADNLVKTYAKPLDDAAKELAATLELQGDVFFAAQDSIRTVDEVGLILTRTKSVISQDDSNAAILARLEDPDFIKNNEKLQEISKHMIAMLEDARDQLREIGFFDKGDTVYVPKAQGLYHKNTNKDEFTTLKEGFFGRIGDAFMRAIRKVGEWFQRTFLPDYSEQEAEYVETLDEWNRYVAELEQETRGMAVAERRIRRVREARRRRLARH